MMEFMDTVQHISAQTRYVTERQVEEIFGLKSATLRRWRREGQGPAFRRIGRRLIRYEIAEVAAWMGTMPQGGRPTIA